MFIDFLTLLFKLQLLCLICINYSQAQIGPPGLIVVPPPAPVITNRCQDMKGKEIEDIMKLPKHQYVVLEQCLYYQLSRDADQAAGDNAHNTIYLLPPSDAKGQQVANVTMNIEEVVLQNLWVNDMMKDAHIRGFVHISWTDNRFTWNQDEWKLKTLQVQSPGHIWLPDLTTSKYTTALASADYLDYRNLFVSPTGNVTGSIKFSLQSSCKVNLENFPHDIHECCFEIVPHLYAEIVKFHVRRPVGRVDEKHFTSTGWKIDSFITSTVEQPNGVAQQLNICLHLSRGWSTLNVELIMPITTCAILVFLAPFFGTFKSQIYLKLFTLLLLFLCLQFMSIKMNVLGLADSTPRIYRFYELTNAMTIISILFSTFFWVAARQQRNLPPPQSLTRMAGLINNVLFCFLPSDNHHVTWDHMSSSRVGGVTSSTSSTSSMDSKNSYQADWARVFTGGHNLLSFVMLIVYAIGIGCIYG